MSCNTCAKPFTLLRKEKGCPSCGFSYCSKCLDNKVFVPKLKAEAKVCSKCHRTANSEKTVVVPPDAYFKRIGVMKSDSVDKPDTSTLPSTSETDQEIAKRLLKLKEDKVKKITTEEEIAQRLQKIKGETRKTTDAELLERLAKLRGAPVCTLQSQPVVIKPDLRTEQEQADDLMKQYLEQVTVDSKYKDEFDGLVTDIELRLGKLKGTDASGSGPSSKPMEVESDDEEETVKKIIEKRVQPEATPLFYKTLENETEDEVLVVNKPTLADSINVTALGTNSYSNVQPFLDKMLIVKEEWISRAVLHMFEIQRMVVEGAGACPLAAVIGNLVPELKLKHVVAIISGGTVNPLIYTRCLERGLSTEGRLVKFRVYIEDKTKAQTQLFRLLENGGYNILRQFQTHRWIQDDVYRLEVELVCVAKDLEHALELKRIIERAYQCNSIFETEPFNDKRACPCYVYKNVCIY